MTGKGQAIDRDLRARQDIHVSLREVSKEFHASKGDFLALDRVSFDVRRGEIIALVGPSGCGKSTILRLVAGLQSATSGSIHIERRDPQRAQFAMVFQDYALFPWLKVRENVAFGLKNRGVPRNERRRLADEQLARVGLSRFADEYPFKLSGGMRQRVGIARALVQDAEVLLMDEPLAALDAQTRILLQEQILTLTRSAASTCLYVTHSIDEAVLLADRIVVMSARPGQVKEIISVDLPEQRSPALRTDRRFIALAEQIWELLRDEVERSMAEEQES